MRLIFITLTSSMLIGCIHGPNPDDPYESINRSIYKFNTAFDTTFLKPPAKLYKAVIPAPVRASVNNFYNNIYMIPTVANDLLQGEVKFAIRDTGRFVINSTIGIGGLFDVASQHNMPMRDTNLGVTFAKWGDKHSPYIVIPFLGPSTIRDGMGLLFEYPLLTPYPYLRNDALIYSLIGLRYIDLRSQYLETEHLMDEALDKYAFMRDAYLQHRQFLITGEQPVNEEGAADSLYVDENPDNATSTDYVDEKPSLTTSTNKTVETKRELNSNTEKSSTH